MYTSIRTRTRESQTPVSYFLLAFHGRLHRILNWKWYRGLESGELMPTNPPISIAALELLRKFDTPTVCNVVELFDLRPRTAGYMDARIQACFPKLPPMVGYAATATFRSAAPPRSGDVYAGIADQVAAFAELPGPAV